MFVVSGTEYGFTPGFVSGSTFGSEPVGTVMYNSRSQLSRIYHGWCRSFVVRLAVYKQSGVLGIPLGI